MYGNLQIWTAQYRKKTILMYRPWYLGLDRQIASHRPAYKSSLIISVLHTFFHKIDLLSVVFENYIIKLSKYKRIISPQITWPIIRSADKTDSQYLTAQQTSKLQQIFLHCNDNGSVSSSHLTRPQWNITVSF